MLLLFLELTAAVVAFYSAKRVCSFKPRCSARFLAGREVRHGAWNGILLDIYNGEAFALIYAWEMWEYGGLEIKR